MSDASKAQSAHFGAFELNRQTLVLTRGGHPIRLAPQPLKLLLLLADSQGRLLRREEIREHLWPDQTVEFDQGLAHCLRKLRSALNDSAKNPRYIETVPRLGLRFLESVEQRTAVEPDSPTAKRTLLMPALLFGFALVLAVLTLAWRSQAFTPVANSTSVGTVTIAASDSEEPALLSLQQAVADRIPEVVQGLISGPWKATVTITRRAESSRPRLVTRLEISGSPSISLDVDVPEMVPPERIARDVANELSALLHRRKREAELGSPQPAQGGAREVTVTLEE